MKKYNRVNVFSAYTSFSVSFIVLNIFNIYVWKASGYSLFLAEEFQKAVVFTFFPAVTLVWYFIVYRRNKFIEVGVDRFSVRRGDEQVFFYSKMSHVRFTPSRTILGPLTAALQFKYDGSKRYKYVNLMPFENWREIFQLIEHARKK